MGGLLPVSREHMATNHARAHLSRCGFLPNRDNHDDTCLDGPSMDRVRRCNRGSAIRALHPSDVTLVVDSSLARLFCGLGHRIVVQDFPNGVGRQQLEQRPDVLLLQENARLIARPCSSDMQDLRGRGNHSQRCPHPRVSVRTAAFALRRVASACVTSVDRDSMIAVVCRPLRSARCSMLMLIGYTGSPIPHGAWRP